LLPPVGWVSVDPEITSLSNFHHFRDTTLNRVVTVILQLLANHQGGFLIVLIKNPDITVNLNIGTAGLTLWQ
jgi:hypothetical protein